MAIKVIDDVPKKSNSSYGRWVVWYEITYPDGMKCTTCTHFFRKKEAEEWIKNPFIEEKPSKNYMF